MENKKILIYRLGSLGDTIIALPAFHAVREAFPNARITLLTNLPVAAKAAPAASVLGEGYFFDDVMCYPVGMRDPRQIFKLIRKIRQLKITVVINLSAFRSAWATRRDKFFFRCAGVDELIGFSTKPEDQQPIIDSSTGMDEWEARRLVRRLSFLRRIDLDDDRWWDLRITQSEMADANALIQPVAQTKRRLALCLGTKLQANDWGTSNWVELTRRLNCRLSGFGLVLIGAHDDWINSEACINEWSGPRVNLSGRCGPRTSAAVLKQCTVFVGHDSGPMHLAACSGLRCVAVFSARNLPGRWFPRGRHNQIIYHRTNCAGCRLEVCITEKKKCISSITVSEVEEAVLKTLNQV